MALQKIPFRTFVEELRKSLRNRSVTFLTGAGISMLHPTRLPSGNALKDMAVSNLCSCKTLRHRWRRIRHKLRYHQITPEVLFQRFYACLGEQKFTPFFHVLDFASPNEAHGLLKALKLRSSCRIMTTNFDLLIERASRRSTPIIHLHGALNRPTSMVTRINQVGRGLGVKMRETVKRNVKQRSLYVLGYSGNDNDVWIAIQASKPKCIFWLVRGPGDFAWRNLNRFGRTHAVNVATGDLRRLIKALSKRHGRTAQGPTVQQTRQREQALRLWANTLSLVERYACLSELFFEIEDYKAVAQISIEAFRSARGSPRSGWFRIQAAEAFKVMGDFRRAAGLAKEAVRINKRMGDPFDIAAAYNIYGLIHVERAKPDLPRAVYALRSANTMARKIILRKYPRHRREAIRNFKARVQNNLGLALSHQGALTEAIACYTKSIQIKKALGDLLGIAITSGNIALVYDRQLKRRLSERWRSNAIALMDRFDLQFQKAYFLRQSGVLACDRGELAKGRQLLLGALKIYSELKQAHFGTKLTKRILKRYPL